MSGETNGCAHLQWLGEGVQSFVSSPGPENPVEALLLSTGIVALAEVGDKTQLLTLVLAARFKKPWSVVTGIFVATLLNHAIAGAAGVWLTGAIGPDAMRWILGLSFIAMAAWMLVPDKIGDDLGTGRKIGGIFFTTAVLFFFVEMGDKTQVATIALAARFDSLGSVVVGTTLGMLVANAPVAFCGDALTRKVPVRVVHVVAACVLAVLGIGVLIWY